MLIRKHRIIVWILIQKKVNRRDLAKVCNFIMYIPRLLIPPKGYIVFIKKRKYIPNRLSTNIRLVILDRFAN